MKRLARPLQAILLAATAVLAGALPARAEIVLLTNGRSLKVTSYQVADELIQLSLASGGKVHLPMHQIDRIVDDEVITPEEQKVEMLKIANVFPNRSWHYDDASGPLFGSRFDRVIVEASRKFNVDAALVSAVIKAESDYDPRIVSRKGAQGLMQLMPATADRFGVTNSFDPVANIYGGTRYLRWLLETFDGNADLAVAAYNAGEGNIWKYKGVPPFRETIQYINRIARHFAPAPSTAGGQTAAR